MNPEPDFRPPRADADAPPWIVCFLIALAIAMLITAGIGAWCSWQDYQGGAESLDTEQSQSVQRNR